ncbi:hypothetical protein PYW08_014419 [Mythimna loreyi]|uniref:Uncharacterized protein n=1 Tax=Mythimna loreyi TaxID=667449 RepID=A0ACC2R8A5_9NEOP|nr:hypothetical protein PYW08_014419 [Mythimna loreyi]
MESLRTNLDLFVILRGEGSSFHHEVLFRAVVDRLGDQITDEDRVTLEEFCRRFVGAASQRWRKSHRILDTFRKQYENWLQADVDWPNCVSRNLVLPQSIEEEYQGSSGHVISPEPSTSTGIGARTMTKRPRKAFEDLGSKQKKRRSDDYKGKESTEVAYSAALLLKEDGREDIASVIEYMMKNPEAASKIKENLKKPVQIAIFTPEKALGTAYDCSCALTAMLTDKQRTCSAAAAAAVAAGEESSTKIIV